MEIEERKRITIRLGKFFTPFLLGFGVYWIWGLFSDEIGKIWPLLAAYFFPPLGKESVIPAGVGLGINPWVMALSIAFIDIIVALFLLWNYDLAKKIPLVGKFMIKVEDIGKSSSEKYSWIKQSNHSVYFWTSESWKRNRICNSGSPKNN